jgi:hypothetical protein
VCRCLRVVGRGSKYAGRGVSIHRRYMQPLSHAPSSAACLPAPLSTPSPTYTLKLLACPLPLPPPPPTHTPPAHTHAGLQRLQAQPAGGAVFPGDCLPDQGHQGGAGGAGAAGVLCHAGVGPGARLLWPGACAGRCGAGGDRHAADLRWGWAGRVSRFGESRAAGGTESTQAATGPACHGHPPYRCQSAVCNHQLCGRLY